MAITFGGLASGLDTSAIIEQLLAVEARPLQRLDQRRATLVSQQGQFDAFRSKLKTLESAITDLGDRDELSLFTTSTTDDTKVKISAAAGAVPGAYNVGVTNLATAKSEAYAFDDQDTTTYGSGTLDFTVDGNQVSVSIDAADTLVDIRDKINSGDAGVRASIINDGTDYQLVITSEETGADNAFSVATTGFGGSNPLTLKGPAQSLETAADANFTVGGLAISSASNTVEDAVDGVTFELLGTTTSDIETTISRDTSAIGDRLQEVVDAYNDVIAFIESQDRNDVGLRGIKSQIDQAFHQQLDTADGFALTALSQAGITTRSGRLELDRGDLEDAIGEDFNDVLDLFAGKADDSATGFAGKLDDVFNGFTDAQSNSVAGILSPGDGALVLRQNSIGDRIRSVDAQIEIAERRLDRTEQNLVRRFAAFEQLQSQFQSQGAFLSAVGF